MHGGTQEEIHREIYRGTHERTTRSGMVALGWSLWDGRSGTVALGRSLWDGRSETAALGRLLWTVALGRLL